LVRNGLPCEALDRICNRIPTQFRVVPLVLAFLVHGLSDEYATRLIRYLYDQRNNENFQQGWGPLGFVYDKRK